jgi:diacylglycerol kinase (ATP)
VAASFGRKDIAELLVSSGANPNTTDNGGNTPISLAKNRDYDEIAVFLQMHVAND